MARGFGERGKMQTPSTSLRVTKGWRLWFSRSQNQHLGNPRFVAGLALGNAGPSTPCASLRSLGMTTLSSYGLLGMATGVGCEAWRDRDSGFDFAKLCADAVQSLDERGGVKGFLPYVPAVSTCAGFLEQVDGR
jgi:hypothetical protein